MSRARTAVMYVQLARRAYWDPSSDLRLVSVTAAAPTRREPATVVVKVLLRIPDEAFDPATHPEVVADIPLELLSPASDVALEPEQVDA